MKERTTSSGMREGPAIRIEDITPDRAAQLLAMNTGNFRPMDRMRVGRYALDMAAGHWELTGDTIKISKGVVIDGQHRLQAIIKSGVTVRNAVAYEVAESSFFIDRGKTRTLGQFLRHENFKNANGVATTAKLCVQHDRSGIDKTVMQITDYSDREVFDYAMKHQGSLEAATAMARKSSRFAPTGVMAAIYHIGSGRIENPADSPLVAWFSDGLATGVGLEEGDAPLTLRNRLMEAKATPAKSMHGLYVRWVCVLAWNKSVAGEKVRNLRVIQSGPSRTDPPRYIRQEEPSS